MPASPYNAVSEVVQKDRTAVARLTERGYRVIPPGGSAGAIRPIITVADLTNYIATQVLPILRLPWSESEPEPERGHSFFDVRNAGSGEVIVTFTVSLTQAERDTIYAALAPVMPLGVVLRVMGRR